MPGTIVAAEPARAQNDYPVFVAYIPNPHDYNLFANGGWDGNWYVGYNTCWVKKLPAVPPGNYERAYIGAKLGRMKLPVTPGAIYMAIASTPAWTQDHSFEIASTLEIPLEGDYESAVEGTSESQWFWAEVPLRLVNLSRENYLALWSPTPGLVTVSSSPILAAAWGGNDHQDTWLIRNITGAPPKTADPLAGSAISYFQPALALKLIRSGSARPMTIKLVDWAPANPRHARPMITADISGDSIQSAWLEYFGKTWKKVGRRIWKAPYVLTVEQTELPPGRVQLRVAASNIWEARAVSQPFTVEISTR